MIQVPLFVDKGSGDGKLLRLRGVSGRQEGCCGQLPWPVERMGQALDCLGCRAGSTLQTCSSGIKVWIVTYKLKKRVDLGQPQLPRSKNVCANF